MANQKNNNQLFLYIILGTALLGLVVGGLLLIIQSNKIYNQSYDITSKVLDPSYNKTITIPTPSYASIKEGYGQALSFFTLALGALFLIILMPRLQNFNIGPTGINVTLKDIQQNLANVVKQQNSMQASSVGEGSIKPLHAMVQVERQNANEDKQKIEQIFIDTQKGKWGGKSKSNGKFIQAVIHDSEFAGFFKVILTVKTTNGEPLKGIVKFHLHESFINPNPVITPVNGEATLTLRKVDCAFTVGAETEDGTELELDLTTIREAPKEFKDCKA